MKRNTPTLQETIRGEAYLLSERAGHPAGMEENFWLQAEALVLGEAAGSSDQDFSPKNGARKTMPKKKAKNSLLQPSEKKAPARKLSGTK